MLDSDEITLSTVLSFDHPQVRCWDDFLDFDPYSADHIFLDSDQFYA
jgi:hypothetical protein